MQTCTSLGFKMSPYLAVEAHLISCGGFATEGKGPFDVQKILQWLRKRAHKVLPGGRDKKTEHRPAKTERFSSLRSSHDVGGSSMLLPNVVPRS